MSPDPDVLIVGAGPAGSVAATVLARAGVKVQIVDRATFPREKLCGDTVNPGTLAELRRLGLAHAIEQRGLPVSGMLVTGENGITIEGRYPAGLVGRALTRSVIDWALLQAAMDAGARFEPGVVVKHALVEESGQGPRVRGVSTVAGPLPAQVTIAADGRRSAVAFGLGLARHPDRPRRWALGAYFQDVHGGSAVGEMHIRRNRYIGVAPVPEGLTNVCLVLARDRNARDTDAQFRDPAQAIRMALHQEPLLRERFADARLVRPPVVLGPLAVDAASRSIDGLLLAGDAAGFIDPMTGDGLRFAVRGGELAAAAALDALTNGWADVHRRLATARRRDFAGKWRFNRALRALVASPRAVRAAGVGARLVPGVVSHIVARAGDCYLAS